jgi:hypothetical protein
MAHSKSAAASAHRRAARLAALTPDERIRLVSRLGEEGIASYMSIHHVDRRTALARIKATRQLGRRRSAAAEADEH